MTTNRITDKKHYENIYEKLGADKMYVEKSKYIMKENTLCSRCNHKPAHYVLYGDAFGASIPLPRKHIILCGTCYVYLDIESEISRNPENKLYPWHL